MIRLTPYEQRMLDGEFGAAKQVSLQKIIDYAQILGAEELVPITKAHLCCGSTCEPSDFPDGNLDRPDILEEDVRLMKKAGINSASVGIFSWSALEPREGGILL